MKRKNNFEKVKQYIWLDKLENETHIIDEDDLENFKENYEVDENPEDFELIEIKTISGKKWNESIFGEYFDDSNEVFIDKDCPKCEHLLLSHKGCQYYSSDCEHCSNCDYKNEATIIQDKIYQEKRKNYKEPIKLKELDLTLEQFGNKYQLDINLNCKKCNKSLKVEDYFCQKGWAYIEYTACCGYGKSCKGTPYNKKEKKEWQQLLGG